jgi:hypothetical protein
MDWLACGSPSKPTCFERLLIQLAEAIFHVGGADKYNEAVIFPECWACHGGCEAYRLASELL